MSALIGFIATLILASTICLAIPDVHKQMSAHQLQSVFHVEHIDAVPHYEIVQLLHHNAAHNRRRRSYNAAAAAATTADKVSHHVKKDLSKNAYYSELKREAASEAHYGGNHLLPERDEHEHMEHMEHKEHNVSFSAFGEQLNLTLRATQGLFKGGAPHALRMWTVNGEPNATHGLDLQEIVDESHQAKHEIGEVFQDEANMAAILMRRHMETGDLIMEGSIGHELVIKPLTHELSPNEAAVHHVVYKRAAAGTDHLSDFAFMEPDDVAASEKLERLQRRQKRSPLAAASQRYSYKDFEDLNDDDEGALDGDADSFGEETAESRTRARRQAPYIIYPEVLVIVDYDGYRLHGGDNLQVKRYFISFWNGVDLRYRLLKGPRIRISIAGIIISRGRDATPYLERNRVGRDAIDSAAALTDMGKYLFRERRLPVYDIAVAITKLDMCRRTSAYGECNRGTAGFAYVGGACVVNKRLEKVNSVAIIEDTGGFSGIIVAAHEVGHLLGAVHDGSPPPSYLGGPGAQRCRWEDGYIMSDLRHTERGFRWSPCTVQSFHHFLNGETATCLHNAPHEDSALGRSLPGTLLSLDAQCRRDRGTYACFKDERVCAQLFCFDAQTGYCVAYRPAAEGSVCGNGLHCLDGRCTPLPSNIIPDYGHQYRLAYNKNNNDKNDAANSSENSSEESGNSDEDDEEENNEETEDSDEVEAPEAEAVGGNQSESSEEVLHDNKIEQSAFTQGLSTTGSAVFTSTTLAAITTTTTTTTTKKPSKKQAIKYLTHFFETPNTNIKNNNSDLANNWQENGGGVVVKISKSSSISSSYSSSAGERESFNGSIYSVDKQQPEIQTTQYETQTPPITTATPTLTPTKTTTQQQQQQQPSSVLKLYTHEFRKQLEYYLNLLQEQQKQQHLYKKQQQEQLVEQKRTNALNSNYSVTNNNNNKNKLIENEGNAGDEHVNDTYPDTDAEHDDNVANNEAIERQKLVNWKAFPF